jgi:hypothetical protein
LNLPTLPSAVTDSNGVATATMTLNSMRPGDNYRVIAGLDSPDVPGIEVNNVLLSQVDRGKIPGSIAITEKALTVWRKLWIERDSMGPVATSGLYKNFVEGISTGYTVLRTGPDARTEISIECPYSLIFPAHTTNDEFARGLYQVEGKIYSVYTNTMHLDSVTVVVKGDLNTDEISPVHNFKIYDDDAIIIEVDGTRTIGYRTKLPNFGIELGEKWTAQFEKAYVEPFYVSGYSDEVPFCKNHGFFDVVYGYGSWNDKHDLDEYSAGNFWTVLVVSGFQPEMPEDKDPGMEIGGKDESATYGQTRGWWTDNECIIYLETIFDGKGPTWESDIMAHELIHTVGGCLTNATHCNDKECLFYNYTHPDATLQKICDNCLHSMRNQDTW